MPTIDQSFDLPRPPVVDYGDSTVFPPFASKASLIQALSDPQNNMERNPLEFLARVANTNTSTWADPTAGLAGNIAGGLA